MTGVPTSVVSLADVEDMPLGRYEQWLSFLRNRQQRRNVAAKAKG